MAAPAQPLTYPALIRQLKADLGTIVRRGQAETLTEEEFAAITGRMRRMLNQLEVEGPDEIELTDLGSAIGRLASAGLLTSHQELLREGPDQGRAYRHLVAIDGGVPTTEPTLKGA